MTARRTVTSAPATLIGPRAFGGASELLFHAESVATVDFGHGDVQSWSWPVPTGRVFTVNWVRIGMSLPTMIGAFSIYSGSTSITLLPPGPIRYRRFATHFPLIGGANLLVLVEVYPPIGDLTVVLEVS